MRIVLQRVSEASVTIDRSEVRAMGMGLVILLGIELEDGPEDMDWLCKKISQLRVFSDKEGKMNLSVMDVRGELMVISQFTLHASTKKGNRPSWIKAAPPEVSEPMYEAFVNKLGQITGKEILQGTFGAHMDVSLVNDGPVTITMDSKNRE